MSDKHVSMEGYQWGHFGAIMFDVIVSGIIAFLAYKTRYMIVSSSKNVLKRSQIVFNLKIIFWLSIIVAFVTLLGLIPVFQDHDRIVIS